MLLAIREKNMSHNQLFPVIRCILCSYSLVADTVTVVNMKVSGLSTVPCTISTHTGTLSSPSLITRFETVKLIIRAVEMWNKYF